MQGVKLVSTPARKTSGSAVAGLSERRCVMSAKFTGAGGGGREAGGGRDACSLRCHGEDRERRAGGQRTTLTHVEGDTAHRRTQFLAHPGRVGEYAEEFLRLYGVLRADGWFPAARRGRCQHLAPRVDARRRAIAGLLHEHAESGE